MAQTSQDWEQVFIVDKIGKHPEGNILWANQQFAANAGRVDGDYVFALDDDGMLIDDYFIETLKKTVVAWNGPEVVLVKTLSPSRPDGGGARILPTEDVWGLDWEAGERPASWAGNGYCVVTRSDVWKARVSNYHSHGKQTGGDWHFCTSLIRGGCQFVRLDICASRSLSRGRGKKFEPCTSDWFERCAARLGIIEIKSGDWRLKL